MADDTPTTLKELITWFNQKKCDKDYFLKYLDWFLISSNPESFPKIIFGDKTREGDVVKGCIIYLNQLNLQLNALLEKKELSKADKKLVITKIMNALMAYAKYKEDGFKLIKKLRTEIKSSENFQDLLTKNKINTVYSEHDLLENIGVINKLKNKLKESLTRIPKEGVGGKVGVITAKFNPVFGKQNLVINFGRLIGFVQKVNNSLWEFNIGLIKNELKKDLLIEIKKSFRTITASLELRLQSSDMIGIKEYNTYVSVFNNELKNVKLIANLLNQALEILIDEEKALDISELNKKIRELLVRRIKIKSEDNFLFFDIYKKATTLNEVITNLKRVCVGYRNMLEGLGKSELYDTYKQMLKKKGDKEVLTKTKTKKKLYELFNKPLVGKKPGLFSRIFRRKKKPSIVEIIYKLPPEKRDEIISILAPEDVRKQRAALIESLSGEKKKAGLESIGGILSDSLIIEHWRTVTNKESLEKINKVLGENEKILKNKNVYIDDLFNIVKNVSSRPGIPLEELKNPAMQEIKAELMSELNKLKKVMAKT